MLLRASVSIVGVAPSTLGLAEDRVRISGAVWLLDFWLRRGYRSAMAVKKKFTVEVRKAYLKELQQGGLFYKAAKAVGWTPETIGLYRKAEPEFEELCQQALKIHRELIEAEIKRRAIDGWDQPVFYQGLPCGTLRKYSDRMLELYAKRHISAYRERHQMDVNVTGGVLAVPSMVPDSQQWEDQHRNSGVDPKAKAGQKSVHRG